METKVKGYASSTAPWRRGAPWYLVIAEGVALLAVGIYSLIAPESAQKTVFAVFGLILAGNGLSGAFSAFKDEPSKRTAYHGFRGGIGLSLGLLALVARFSDSFTGDTARLILAFGYLLVGIVSLVALVVARADRKFPLASLAVNMALIVIALVFFTGSSGDSSRITLIGWISIVVGLLLLAFGYYLKTKPAAAAGEGSATSPSSSRVETKVVEVAPVVDAPTDPSTGTDLPG